MFEEGEMVVKVIHGGGTSTATIQEVHKVEDGEVTIRHPRYRSRELEEDINRVHQYDAETGKEKPGAASIPGFSSKLVKLDGGQEERIREGDWE